MNKEIPVLIDTALLPFTMLRAGELTCMYENGRLRYIMHGKTELIRMLYVTVRNHHWRTLPFNIEDEQVTIFEAGFLIEYNAVYHQHGAVYKTYSRIEGKPGNSIVFSMKGEALAAFQKNRIGICVHHPIAGCSGRTAIVTQPDGETYQASFPVQVAPWQPFREVQQMQWDTADGKNVQLSFEGDIFETEDQRNWSDASFKTYSTPQRIPFPVSIQAGDTIEQSVRLTVSSAETQLKPPVHKSMAEDKVPFPRIGYCRSKNQAPLAMAETEWLHTIPFHHYRVVIAMQDAGWLQLLNTALQESVQLKTQLELLVYFTNDFYKEATALVACLIEKQQFVYSILVLQQGQPVSSKHLLAAIYPLLKKSLPQIEIGYGTDRFFANLNRQRPDETPCDFISFSLHPQVHATDTRTIFENLQNQSDLITTAKIFAGEKRVHISPVTLQDRSENDGPDKRQHTSTAACWTLLTLQQLSSADAITYYELFGPDGLLKIIPGKDGNNTVIEPSIIYQLLSEIYLFQPLWIIKRYKQEGIVLDGLLLENAVGGRLFFKIPINLIF